MALLTREAQEKVVELLVNEGLVDGDAVAQARGAAEQKRQSLLATLASMRLVSDEALAHAQAVVIGVPYVNLKNVIMDNETLALLGKNVAERSMAVPLGEKNGALVLAMIDVTNVQATDYLSSLTGKQIIAVMASTEGVMAILSQYKGDFSSVNQAVKATNAAEAAEEAERMSADVKTITEDSPISKALSTILEYAARSKASDIHIEPLEDALVIRCRIDGVLRKVMELPKAIEPALVSRIKILANLKIDEHRTPQDGQFTVAVGDKEIDLRSIGR